MKILYVTTISNTVNAFLIPHIKLLKDQGHQVDVAFNIVQEVNPELAGMGCRIHIIEFQRSPLKKDNYAAYKKLKKLIREEEYDIVHTHTPVASAFVRFACRNIHNVKVVYTAHGFHFYKGAPLLNWLVYYPIEKMAAKCTDTIITINEEDYNIAKKIKPEKIHSVVKVHGVGVDLNKFSPQNLSEKSELRSKYGYKKDDFILFYAAELNSNKHQDLLINVVSELKSFIPNIRLLLAGTGNLMERYEEQARNLKIQENVKFLGFRQDIHKLLKISDIAVASSKREGLPVNIMEAMATGLPLVVTDCRGQRDLVINDENGFIVGVDDIEGFVVAIKKLYESEDLRNSFSRNNIQSIKKYSIYNVIKEMKKLYQPDLY